MNIINLSNFNNYTNNIQVKSNKFYFNTFSTNNTDNNESENNLNWNNKTDNNIIDSNNILQSAGEKKTKRIYFMKIRKIFEKIKIK